METKKSQKMFSIVLPAHNAEKRPKGSVMELESLIKEGSAISIDDAIRDAVREYTRERTRMKLE